MKKRWIWLVVTAAVLTGAVAAVSQPAAEVTVNAVTLTPERVEQTVSCMGAVEAADGNGVFAPVSCWIGQVDVKEGQRVRKGDVLAQVDKDTTRQQMLSDPAGLVVLAAMPEQLTAPADGIVVSVMAQPGQTLEWGTPCAVIAYDSDIRVRIAIRERDLRVLESGMSVRVSGDGFQKSTYEGTLTEISSSASVNVDSGTVVEGVVSLKEGQVDPSLRLGLTAKASVVTSVTEEGLVIPYDAVLSDETGSYVYLAENGVARRHDLTDYQQVTKGVLLPDCALEGLQVITQPDKVTDGQTVTVREEQL